MKTSVKDFTNSFILKCNEFRALVNLDKLGVIASSVCLVHCLVLPFVLILLPFAGLEYLASNAAHKVLAFFVLLFALTAIVPGYLQHRRKTILIAMLFGLSLVMLATFSLAALNLSNLETPLITVGNLILVATHLQNRRHLSKLHNISCHDHVH